MNIFGKALGLLGNLPGIGMLAKLGESLMSGFKSSGASNAAQTMAAGAFGDGAVRGLFGEHEVPDSKYEKDDIESKY